MSEVRRMAEQLKRSYEGEAWAGQALREALEGVTADEAAARPIPSAHSIGEIAAHAAAWAEVVRRRLGGEGLREPAAGDWPVVADWSEDAWAALRGQLDAAQAALVSAVTELDEAGLDEAAAAGFSPRYNQVHGLIQHNLYHAAQIAILKKAVRGD